MTLMTRYRTKVRGAFKSLEATARYDLQINEGKTKYLEASAGGRALFTLLKASRRRKYNFERVCQFEYLRVIMASVCEEELKEEKEYLKGLFKRD